MSDPAPLRVRVGIPHFFREEAAGSPYGSGQPGARQARGLALGRCLAALLDLQRGRRDLRLHIGARQIEGLPSLPPLVGGADRPLELEIHIGTDGHNRLEEVLALFADRITVHTLPLREPRELALRTRDFLIREGESAELTLYLEDDLVIADPLFLDKQSWFLAQTGGELVLMPHRYERVDQDGAGVLLIDGPLREGFIHRFRAPGPSREVGRFAGGPPIRCEVPANPHAGCFCLHRAQVERLQRLPLAEGGFIGPLETAATLTVLEHLEVVKPCLAQWRFLCLEHAHRGFVGYRERFPLVPLALTPSPPASGAAP